jgi:hypothetical protein
MANRIVWVLIVAGLALVASWIAGSTAVGIGVVLGAFAVAVMRLVVATKSPVVHLAAGSFDAVDGWSEFRRELQRARRFDRGFAIVRFGIVEGADPAHIRDRVASSTRRVDRVWLDDGELFMLLPEADPNGAETAILRIRQWVGDALAVDATAAFPGNGITSGALIASLYDAGAAPVAIGVSSRDVVPISAAVAQEAAEQADEEAAVVS